MIQSSTYKPRGKALISILLGILSLLFSPYSFEVVFKEVTINIPWSIILPLLVAMAYGWRYSILASLSGGVYFPFLLWADDGWANVSTALIYLGINVFFGLIYDRRFLRKVKNYLYRILTAVVLSILIIFTYDGLLLNLILKLNPCFWEKNTINHLPSDLLYGLAFKDSINIILLVIVSETILNLPFIRRLFGIPSRPVMASNSLLFFITISTFFSVWLIYVGLGFTLLSGNNSLQTEHVILALMVILSCGFLVARMLFYYNENKLDIQGKLTYSEEKFKALFENANDAIFVLKDGKFIDCNPITLKIFGCELTDIIGQSPDFFSPVNQPDGNLSKSRAAQLIEQATKGQPLRFEWMHSRLDGSLFEAEVSLNSLYLNDEMLLQAIVRDVSERKRSEKLIRENENRIRSIFDLSVGFMGLLNPEGIVLAVNNAALEFAAIKIEDVIGRYIWDTPWWSHSIQMQYLIRESVISAANGTLVRSEAMQPAKDGIIHFIDFTLKPVKEENGPSSMLILEGRDITERKHAEEALSKSRALITSIIESTSDLIWSIDPADYHLITFNNAFRQHFIRTRGLEVKVGYLPEDILPAHYAASWHKFYHKVIEEGPYNTEYITHDGLHMMDLSFNILKHDNTIVGISVFGKDITERNKTLEALKESENKYSRIVNTANEGILAVENSSNINYVNRQICEMLGYEPQEMIGQPIGKFIYQDDLNDHQNKVERRKAGISEKFERRFIRKDGSVIWCLVSATALMDKATNNQGSFAMLTDITERKVAEQAVLESEKRFRAIFDQAPIAMAVLDTQGHPFLSNTPLSKMVGYSHEELSKMTFADFTHPEDVDKDRSQFELLVEGKISMYNFEKRYIHKNGNIVWGNLFVTILRDEEGNMKEIIGMAVDITDRKLAETALKRSEKRFLDALEFQPTPISIAIDNIIIHQNQQFKTAFGYELEEITTIEEWMNHAYPDPAYRERTMKIWSNDVANAITGNTSTPVREYLVTCKDGSTKWMEICGRAVGDMFIAVFNDVTVRKLAEAALIESEKRFRLISTLSGHMVYEYNLAEDTHIWEGAIQQLTGHTAGEYEKVNFQIWLETLHPDDKEKTLNQFNDFINHDKPFHTEYRYKNKNGNYVWIEDESFVFARKDGQVSKVVGVMKDITERKSVERQILNGVIETEERERMHFSQELHDGIGPLLSAIKMYVQMIAHSSGNIDKPVILSEIEKLINESSRTIREISFKLSPHILQNYGLIEAVKAYTDKVKESSSITIELRTENTFRLADKIETIAYRVICECITNTLKHAKASRISIRMKLDKDILITEFKDNGIGFNVQEVINGYKGIGLLNMQSRLKSVNGLMDISSNPESGTSIKFQIKTLND